MTELTLIADFKRRQGIFQTRKRGLFKKAYELQALCGSEVCILVRENGKLYAFSSCEDKEPNLLPAKIDEITECWGPSDFQTKRQALEASVPRKRKNSTSNILVESQGPDDFQTKRQAIESGELTREGYRVKEVAGGGGDKVCDLKFLPIAPTF